MALFNFGKKKEEEKKTPACACSCGCAASEAESITNDCCPDLKEGEICCIKVLSGCKSCHEQFEYTKQAVKDMGLSVEVEYITDMQKVMEYGVMSMPALVVNEKVVAMGKVLKAVDEMCIRDRCKSFRWVDRIHQRRKAFRPMGNTSVGYRQRL